MSARTKTHILPSPKQIPVLPHSLSFLFFHPLFPKEISFPQAVLFTSYSNPLGNLFTFFSVTLF
ncbi:Hypothetical protein Minf_2060 [Methylacidiphilum infernorum V4]|uniref:Uncharacterized protein n=1 Tax=Methylacidiphilum infernorum (isolate V4) TaxID=481448 RepID=B3DZ22_METI4|nr:Hypothetical protein Minf_2060 [Methylacidiphilum infernorum V4]